MKADIHLFINDKEIEFSKDPQILFNYKLSDTTNPVAVKNSFSKSITIEGTPRNNDIFSNIWNIESYYNGANFNHFKKADFVIYVNGSIYEKGYAKLDSITMKNHNVEYSISLYGGLGQFIWNLTYTNGEGNTKLSLADLSFKTDIYPEPDFEFKITKEAVFDAWNTIMGNPNAVYKESEVNRPNNYLYNERWNVFNFAPVCNGVPQNFDAAKVLINRKNIPNGIFTMYQDGYAPVNGYMLAETSEDLTEWETRDLRSYNQRGVLNMSRIIDACCQPENNGGYQVKLDEHFFHWNNPYYSDAWVTTKMCSEMELENGQSTEIDNATLNETNNYLYSKMDVVYEKSSISTYTNLNMKVKFKAVPKDGNTEPYLYTHTSYDTDTTFTLQGERFIKWYKGSSHICVQLLARDASNRIIGYSKAYILGDDTYDAYYKGDVRDTQFVSSQDGEYTFIKGRFKYIDGEYVFVDYDDNIQGIEFTLKSQAQFDHLDFMVWHNHSHRMKYVWSGNGARGSEAFRLYKTNTYSDKGNHSWDLVLKQRLGETLADLKMEIDSFSVTENDYEGLISGSKVTKDKLLASDKSPADYLLSYCKIFGLHIFQDPTEESDDPVRYPKGVIHIMDRDTFYKREEVVDISKMIDYNKGIQMTPQVAGSKFYSFTIPQIDSDAAESYKRTYKNSFGEKVINTNYDFDSSTKNLYDGSAFKGGVMVREKDKYFNESPDIPIYAYNGLKYTLYKIGEGYEYDTIELDLTPKKISSAPINIYRLAYYDCIPKLQTHSADNESIDGADILLFYIKDEQTQGSMGLVDYWLTDDISEMGLLNDAAPCWIMTMDETNMAGVRIAYKINRLPWFSRQICYGGQEGIITHSWDFGGSQVTYVPNTYNSDEMGIYEKCWKNYINDMYSINSRKLTCWLNLMEKPNMDWLRRFYWFENSIWRINSIIDYNMSIDGLTKFEFIKVQDTDNYAVDKITNSGAMRIVLDKTFINHQGGELGGYVYIQDGGNWAFADSVYAVDEEGNVYYYDSEDILTPVSGSGISTEFVMNVPANTTGKVLTWHIALAKWVWEVSGNRVEARFIQNPDGDGALEFVPEDVERSIDYKSQTLTFRYTSNKILEESIEVSVGNYISEFNLNKETKTVTVVVDKNETSDERNTTVTITGIDEGRKRVTDIARITQGANGINVTPETVVIDYNYNLSNSFNVDTDSTWTITLNDN